MALDAYVGKSYSGKVCVDVSCLDMMSGGLASDIKLLLRVKEALDAAWNAGTKDHWGLPQ
jgi:hypothetical protein